MKPASASRCVVWPHLVVAGLIFGWGAGGRAVELPADEQVFELPTFVVTDSRHLPPPESWRYASIPGFEILSNASDRETKRLMRDFQRFQYALSVVWPVSQSEAAIPLTLIFSAAKNRFDAFRPAALGRDDPLAGTASLFLRDEQQGAIVLDLEAKTLPIQTPETMAGSIFESLLMSGAVETSLNVPLGGEPGLAVDHRKQLYREYVRYLLSRGQRRAPAWMEEGMLQLFMGIVVERDTIIFARVGDPNVGRLPQTYGEAQALLQEIARREAQGDYSLTMDLQDLLLSRQGHGDEEGDFNRALSRRKLMPLDEFFAVDHDSPIALNPIGSLWAKQAQAFVHYCLYSRGQKHQRAFMTFLARLQQEPVSEDLFRECFGLTYAQMLRDLRGYVTGGNYQAFRYKSKDGPLPNPEELELREATEAEVGRIKGEALRLAGHAEAARTAMIAPYLRGSREPALLASLGLAELAGGQEARARRFLEAAVAGNVVNPRAYFSLALMRYVEALNQVGPEGRLDNAQSANILSPLLVARRQTPALPEAYLLMAETWLRSQATPKQEDVVVVIEGVRMFPRNLTLMYRTAELCLLADMTEPAASLIEHGIRWAPNDASRARFASLQATLPPVSQAPEETPVRPSAGAAAP